MDQPTDRNRPDKDQRNIFDTSGLLDVDGVSRRKLLQLGAIGAGALALPGILAACGGGGGSTTAGSTAGAETSENPELKKLLDNIESKQVIIGNYGGDTEEARKKVFWEPFESRTGVQVISADAGSLAVPMILGEIPTKWDAVHGSLAEAYGAQLFGKKPLPETPKVAWEDLIPKEFQPKIWQSFALGYVYGTIEGNFETEPSSWADFFDTKKFPGKRAWPASYFVGGQTEAALFADGVEPDEMYPLDLERAQAKIETIKDDLVIYTEYPQAQSFLTSKTASLSYAPNGLFHELELKGVAASVIWDATPIINWNGMNIMPEPPNEDAVMALAGFCNQPKLQAEFAKLTNYGPPTEEAFESLSPEELENLPNSPKRTNVFYEDPKYQGKHYGEISEANAKAIGE